MVSCFFVQNSKGLTENMFLVKNIVQQDTVVWIIRPKKKSDISTDLDMADSRDVFKAFGLRAVSAVSVDKHWTGLRLKPEKATRRSAFADEALRRNEYGRFIDVVSRQITLPADMQTALQHSDGARECFEKLSFTNKKEYVVWILSAKQEKTRAARLEKLPGKLLAGKRNPAEK